MTSLQCSFFKVLEDHDASLQLSVTQRSSLGSNVKVNIYGSPGSGPQIVM